MYTFWRTMVGGDLAFGPLIWFNQGSMAFIGDYNIAFVNSERWLAKSRVEITLCQHGKYKTHFPYWYTVISTLAKIGKTRNCMCENTPPCGRRVSTQFLVFPISTRVDITVYQHGNVLYFLNITLEKCIFLYFLTHFDLLDLCLWLRGDIVLDFCVVAISYNTLQQVARDNFGILQTLKFCVVKASWVFTTCRLIYLDWRSFNFL